MPVKELRHRRQKQMFNPLRLLLGQLLPIRENMALDDRDVPPDPVVLGTDQVRITRQSFPEIERHVCWCRDAELASEQFERVPDRAICQPEVVWRGSSPEQDSLQRRELNSGEVRRSGSVQDRVCRPIAQLVPVHKRHRAKLGIPLK
jgi:hypothetical protein